MKNLSTIILITILSISIFSCTPQTNATDDTIPAFLDEENCCGEDSPIPPPPPSND